MAPTIRLEAPASRCRTSRPQRLAVSATGDAGRPVGAGEQRKIAVNARFLYGAPGSGLQAQVEAKIAPDADPFPAYKDYRWGDEVTAFDGKLVQLPQTTTDGAGNTAVTLDTSEVAAAIQPLSAAVTASVLEPGGRPVTDGLTLKLRPRPLYFGVHVVQGEPRRGADPELRGHRGERRRPARRRSGDLRADLGELDLRLVRAGRPLGASIAPSATASSPTARSPSARAHRGG